MPVHFSFYAFVISVVAMVVVSMVTTKTSERVLDETMTGWYIRK
jgi:SSS family solute:Na+ symporter